MRFHETSYLGVILANSNENPTLLWYPSVNLKNKKKTGEGGGGGGRGDIVYDFFLMMITYTNCIRSFRQGYII